jgi:hypothetical protein
MIQVLFVTSFHGIESCHGSIQKITLSSVALCSET